METGKGVACSWKRVGRDLGYKVAGVVTVAKHLGHRSGTYTVEDLGCDAGVAVLRTRRGCPKVHRGCDTLPSKLPPVTLREGRVTSDVSPFEHAPALTRESAFN